jgi:hypothetical protein
MLRPIAEPGDIIKAQDAMRAMIRGALIMGTAPGTGDYGIAPGTTDKKALWKPGAEKIVNAMGCVFGAPRIVEREVDHDRVVTWVKRKKVTREENGRRFSDWEEVSGQSYGLYRYLVEVPIINRATGEIVGTGLGSCSSMESKYIDRPRDVENTIIKMAHKRAAVHATLLAFALSGEMQSGEDDDEEGEPGEAPAPARRTAAPKKAAPSGGAASCPKCSGAMWDNRAKKADGTFKSNAPDFSCKNKDCGGKIWPARSKDESSELTGNAFLDELEEDLGL